MGRIFTRWIAALLVMAVALPGWSQSDPPPFTKEQLDQLMAPVALYPDSLLTQVLMAATYPAQVTEAVTWSAAHPNDKGDAAVTKADSEGWEPAVTSLVAFPQVLATMGEKPDWVQDMGDAFLAQPEDTMDSVQRLRKMAQDAGQLKSNEQQKVVVEQPTAQQSVIVIEPAQPQVVYVPTYNPTVVYGTWPYPTYPPYYIPPPPGYAFGNALLTGMAFGAGLAITNSLWGGYNWGRNDVNINVNRYNNVNVNRRITNNNNNNFTHNSNARKGVPYRDQKSNDRYGKNVAGKDARNDYRGRDPKAAQRDAARNTLADRTNDPATRERLQKEGANRGGAQDRSDSRGAKRPDAAGANRTDAGGAKDRAAAANRSRPTPSRASRDNALSGAGNGKAERAQMERGQASRQAAAKPAARPAPRQASPPRAQSRPAPSRPSGGGARGGGRRGR